MEPIQDLSLYFRALADRKRLDIVEYLAEHDQCTVTELGELMHLSQPLISWHLRKLRRTGIIKTRRSGRQVWCSLDRATLKAYQDRITATLGLGDIDAAPASEVPLHIGRTAAG